MKCQKCGNEYEGNFCPNGCNSPHHQNQKKKKAKGIILGITFICISVFAITMGILFGEDTPEDLSSNLSSTEIEYIEISADELYKAFEENEVAADEKYKGKYVKVTGIVTEISSGGTFTQPCILLNVEDSIIFGDVQCNFSDDNAAKKIAEINKGEKITVTGLCTGLGDFNLDIHHCEIQ